MRRARVAGVLMAAMLAGCGAAPAPPGSPPAPPEGAEPGARASSDILLSPDRTEMRLLVIRDAPVMLFPDGERSMVGFDFDLSESLPGDAFVMQFLHVSDGRAVPEGTYVHGGEGASGSVSWSVPRTDELHVAFIASSDSAVPRRLEMEITGGASAAWSPLRSNVTHALAAYGDFRDALDPLARNVDVRDERQDALAGRTGTLTVMTRPDEASASLLYACASTTSVGVGEWSLRLEQGGATERFGGYTGAFSGGVALFLDHVEGPGAATYQYDVTGSRNESVSFLRWAVHVAPDELPFAVEPLDSRDPLGRPVMAAC